GGHQVISGTMTLGTVVAFVFYLGRLYGPASALVSAHVGIMTAVALFRRIFEYLDLPIEVPERADPVRLTDVKGRLRFEDVGMRYKEGAWTLEDVSFEAAPGQMIALVGPSGAGKTTLTYLACRLYDPAKGRIVIDGVDLRDVALDDLPRAIAKVTQ